MCKYVGKETIILWILFVKAKCSFKLRYCYKKVSFSDCYWMDLIYSPVFFMFLATRGEVSTASADMGQQNFRGFWQGGKFFNHIFWKYQKIITFFGSHQATKKIFQACCNWLENGQTLRRVSTWQVAFRPKKVF